MAAHPLWHAGVFTMCIASLLATEIGFLWALLAQQLPTASGVSFRCFPGTPACPSILECAVRGQADKHMALVILALTACVSILICLTYGVQHQAAGTLTPLHDRDVQRHRWEPPDERILTGHGLKFVWRLGVKKAPNQELKNLLIASDKEAEPAKMLVVRNQELELEQKEKIADMEGEAAERERLCFEHEQRMAYIRLQELEAKAKVDRLKLQLKRIKEQQELYHPGKPAPLNNEDGDRISPVCNNVYTLFDSKQLFVCNQIYPNTATFYINALTVSWDPNCERLSEVYRSTDFALERPCMDSFEKVSNEIKIVREFKQPYKLNELVGETMVSGQDCLHVVSLSKQSVSQVQRDDWTAKSAEQEEQEGIQGRAGKLSSLGILDLSCSLLVALTSDSMWKQRLVMDGQRNLESNMLVEMDRQSPALELVKPEDLKTSKQASVCVDANYLTDCGERDLPVPVSKKDTPSQSMDSVKQKSSDFDSPEKEGRGKVYYANGSHR
ncbi:hypothetical protein UY3_02026 [Chelonia mydas]|uniref:Uncharacterized protein n=1 Tax=Chelonia mydas TaxID=8469 RepID=M7BS71_CHEMY|nr:hypothetical protein UY3_02026 [Chelonia mydas]